MSKMLPRQMELVREDSDVLSEVQDFLHSRKKLSLLDDVENLVSISRPKLAKYAEIAEKALDESDDRETALMTEAIVLMVGRPAFLIKEGKLDDGELNDSRHRVPTLVGRIDANRARIESRFPSIGRIELVSHPDFEWVGTGWMIDDHVLATNRHVANVFATRTGRMFGFQRHQGISVGARVDFNEEFGSFAGDAEEVVVKEILYIAPDGFRNPDIAFLKLECGGGLPEPLELAERDPVGGEDVGIVGYPARDGRRNPGPAMARIFKDIYDVKRFAPGKLRSPSGTSITHDCSTLGGNSGSPVISLDDGRVLGLHYAGRFSQANFAVPPSLIKRELGS